MMEKEKIDLKLLDYLFNELNEEERLKIELWIQTSEKNRRYFQHFQQSHNYLYWGNRMKLIRGDFSVIRKRIHHRVLVYRLSACAALIILFLGVAWGLWIKNEDNKDSVLSVAAQISPGKSKALLQLSSGKVIPLTTEIKEVHEEDGTFIRVNQEGVISYDSVASQNQKPLMNRITVPRGGEFQLTLEDGTHVWLNSNSEIIYPTHFTGPDRKVCLKGEAYFEVTKDEERPFIVSVEHIAVKVYGTKFNVNSQIPGIIETVLVEGSVGIQTSNQETMLKPNQMASYNEECGTVTVEDVDIATYIAWKDGNFVFSNETLENIMNKLSLWYDVDIFYANDDVRRIRLSGDMVRYKDIQSLFYFFERISNVKFQIKGKTIIVSYK